jgi:hypothetical protein
MSSTPSRSIRLPKLSKAGWNPRDRERRVLQAVGIEGQDYAAYAESTNVPPAIVKRWLSSAQRAESERKALIAVDVEGRHYEDYALSIAEAPGTVARWLSKARERIGFCLEAAGFIERETEDPDCSADTPESRPDKPSPRPASPALSAALPSDDETPETRRRKKIIEILNCYGEVVGQVIPQKPRQQRRARKKKERPT